MLVAPSAFVCICSAQANMVDNMLACAEESIIFSMVACLFAWHFFVLLHCGSVNRDSVFP